MFDVLNKRYLWPKVREQEQPFCRTCQVYKALKKPNRTVVPKLPSMEMGGPGEGFGVIGPLPPTEREHR